MRSLHHRLLRKHLFRFTKWIAIGQRSKNCRRRLQGGFEQLEPRTLLAADAVADQFLVSETFAVEGSPPAVALLDGNAGGGFVAAWESFEDAGDESGFGVHVNVYDQSGQPRSSFGGPLIANQTTLGDQRAPAVGTDASGDLLVVWQSKDELHPDRGYDVYARWYEYVAASGNWQAQPEFLVNAAVVEGDQLAPSVAMAPDGQTVIAWQSEGQDGDGFGIRAVALARLATTGEEFQVNTQTVGDQTAPAAAMAPGGQFVIAWQGPGDAAGQEEASLDVFGRRFTDASHPLDAVDVQINQSSTHDQVTPQVAMGADGSFAATWVSEGIPGSGSDVFARQWFADGSGWGSEFRVNEITSGNQRSPSVAMDAEGNYIVTWQSVHQDGFSWGIFASAYTAAGDPVKSDFLVNTRVEGPQTSPTVTMAPNGASLIAWLGRNENHESSLHAQQYEWVETEDVPSDLATVDGELSLGTYLEIEESPPAAAMDRDGQSIVAWQSFGEDGSGLGVFAQRLDASGAPVGSRFLVNASLTLGNQSDPSVAYDPKGGTLVVVWQTDDASGTGHDVYASLYRADGTPIDAMIPVSGARVGIHPSVAMDKSGAFVVVWQTEENDANGSEIYAQRFDATGSALGQAFQVNQFDASGQYTPRVAMNEHGEFVVAWVSDHVASEEDEEKSVFAQWFDRNGQSDGPEVLVHEYVARAQEHPWVAIDKKGDFVVTWQSIIQDGNSWGVYARQFTRDRVPLQPELLVNETTDGPQRFPSVGMDSRGNFVVAWQSNTHAQDGSSWNVYMRQYSADGQPLRSEELVNTWTMGPQIHPVVARATTGDFGVFWTGQGSGHTEGVFGRLYAEPEPPFGPPTAGQPPQSIGVGDLAVMINTVRAASSTGGARLAADSPSLDLNGDGVIDLSDVLQGIRHLRSGGGAGAEGESGSAVKPASNGPAMVSVPLVPAAMPASRDVQSGAAPAWEPSVVLQAAGTPLLSGAAPTIPRGQYEVGAVPLQQADPRLRLILEGGAVQTLTGDGRGSLNQKQPFSERTLAEGGGYDFRDYPPAHTAWSFRLGAVLENIATDIGRHGHDAGL